VSDMARMNCCEKRGDMRVLRNKVFMEMQETTRVLHSDSRGICMCGLGNCSPSSKRHACRHQFCGGTVRARAGS
jgi:hypothetical protein